MNAVCVSASVRFECVRLHEAFVVLGPLSVLRL
jgi:hypothetical protein